jgi:hypothetical protein
VELYRLLSNQFHHLFSFQQSFQLAPIYRLRTNIQILWVLQNKPASLCQSRLPSVFQRSVLLDVYEEQIREYLKTFHIPEDYQLKILEAHRKLEGACDNLDRERAKWKAQLERIRDMYKWGDMTKEDYLKEKQIVLKELNALTPAESHTQNLERLAYFLTSVANAWDEAKQEQRNKLTHTLFQEVWLKDDQVVAIKPQPELEPFFQLNYKEFVNKGLKMRPRGDSNPRSPP